MIRTICAVVITAVLAGCTGQRLADAPPEDRYELAVPPGFPPSIRFYGDKVPDGIDTRFTTIHAQLSARIEREGEFPNGGAADILTLSGGGSDGAYGAGLLNGWTRRGGRPEFALVTGISTGALIAPLAFLGSSQDCKLENLYTNLSTDDLVITQIFKALTGGALGLSGGGALAQRIQDVLDPRTLDRIAEEHGKGRRLWIGTTNLDAQRPVVWDIGAIASSGHPNRQALIRDVLLASASIPGVFPPVEIVVELDGQRYAEMHMDGGVTRQIFFLPVRIDLQDRLEGGPDRLQSGTIYALRNTKLDPDYEAVVPSLVDIAGRSVSTLIKSAGVSDILVIEGQARANDFGLQVTSVPGDFDVPETEFFDPTYMRALFDVGFQSALQGSAWNTVIEASAVPDAGSLAPPTDATACD
ncbi:MAG: patatin-like phospholipase family protein [Pseudomonadota bacterium]